MEWIDALKDMSARREWKNCEAFCSNEKIYQDVGFGERSYAYGLLLLNECLRSSDEDIYRRAVNALLAAYEAGYAARDIIDLFKETIWKPQILRMKTVYEENLHWLKERRGVCTFAAFSSLPIMALPVTKTFFRIYEKCSASFLPLSKVNREYQYFAVLTQTPAWEMDAAQLEEIVCFDKQRQAAALLRKWREGGFASLSLKDIARYHALYPACEKYEQLSALYWLRKKEYKKAEQWVEAALEKRKINFELRVLCGQVKEELGKYEEALYHYTLALKYGKGTFYHDVSPRRSACLNQLKAVSQERLQTGLRQIGRAASDIRTAPWTQLCRLGQDGRLEFDFDCHSGAFLHGDAGAAGLFTGYYNEASQMDARGKVDDYLKSINAPPAWRVDEIYDLCVCQNSNFLTCAKEETPYLLPLIPKFAAQEFKFSFARQEKFIHMGKGETNFFRINEETVIASEQEFSFGAPIFLRHAPKRKKIVLNIFVDALSYAYLKQKNYASMPNVMEFFKKGIIFDHNYSAAEWTYPSVAAMQTGVSLSKTQMFHPYANFTISDHLRTIAQHYRAAGYYCIEVMESLENLYSNVCKGYDRVLANFVTRAYVGVERAIRHLKALKETDVFMTMHFLDMHPLFNSQFQIDIETQARLDLQDRFFKSSQKSAFMECSPLNILQYQESMENVDRALGTLFAYLEKHYCDEEILVALYSDHGVSIFEQDGFLLSDYHTRTAFMLRGRDIPAVGLWDKEMTSGLDLYPVMAKLEGCAIDKETIDGHVPAVLGGSGCGYAISQSLYPGQTYKLAIRTLRYEFLLETLRATTYDGRIDMNHFTCRILDRHEARREIYDEKVKTYFLAIAYRHMESLHDPDYVRNFGQITNQ